ncbi:MAG TPA: cytochrome c [Acidobacteriaceae bacterium]|jgi:mono/diheme cytochrome c family protein|nr:cytochrome c [Acidobacteriaceae bacterium]
MRAFLQSAFICAVVGCAIAALSSLQPLPSVSAGSNAKQRGAELFAQHGCAHCHGPAGVGGGKGPDLQLVRKRMNKDQIAHQIHDGGMSMPSFANSLTSPEIQDLVAYLRAKRKFVKVPASSHPSPPAPTPTGSDPD